MTLCSNKVTASEILGNIIKLSQTKINHIINEIFRNQPSIHY